GRGGRPPGAPMRRDLRIGPHRPGGSADRRSARGDRGRRGWRRGWRPGRWRGRRGGATMSDRLSLAGWSLVRRFRRPDDPLALFDFPRVAREEFGFDAVELNSPFFAANEGAYVKELRRLADEEGVALLGIAVDGEGDLAALDPAARREAVARHLPWLDAGAVLGCRFVRANLGGRD